MEVISKQAKSKSHEEFLRLVSEDLSNRKFTEGTIVKATIEEITSKWVFVDLGLKSSGAIPIEEYKLTKEIENLKVNDETTVLLEKLESRDGTIVVSRERARKVASWNRMQKAFDNGTECEGFIISKVRGGFCVDVNSCLCFLPGSQVDIRPLKSYDHLMGKKLNFLVAKIDKKRQNIVLSRRAIMEKIRDHDRDKIVAKLSENQIVDGTVKNLTEWGAFIDLDGVDSLLHITDIAWSRITNPSQVLSVGQSLKVKILKIDESTKKISVGLKQLTEDLFLKAIVKYEVGKDYPAIVTKTTDYGCFAQLEPGLEGLVHQSELSYVKKNIHPGKVLTTSQKISVRVLEKDLSKRRLSLSYRLTQINPWTKFTKDYKVGQECETVIKNVTDFAIFATIKNTELDGMCHKNDVHRFFKDSDLKKFKKGQSCTFKILEIDESKEKIRLGLKQLKPDLFNLFFKEKKVSDVITTIVDFTNNNGVYVTVGNDKENPILIKRNQLARDVENSRISRFVPGQKVDCQITELNLEKNKVVLSIKSLEEEEYKKLKKKYGSTTSGALLGDLLGPLLNKKKKPKKEE